MMKHFLVIAPPVALILVGVLIVEPPYFTPADRVPTLRVFAGAFARAGAAQTTYARVDHWAQLPADVTWGQAISVDLAPDQQHIYAFHRSEPPILRFDLSGRLVQSWGEAMFAWPHGFHVDPDGNLWATDGGRAGEGHQVFKFSPDGQVLMTLGTAGVTGDGPDTFNGPTDVAVAQNGDVFVTDGHGNNRVVKFSHDGAFITAWGRKGTGPGEFDLPHTIAIDSRGRLFVGDRSNQRIQIFDQDGNFLEEWPQFGMPSGIYITADDTIYLADYQQHEALLIGSAMDGSITGRIESVIAEGITVDAAGNIYAGEVAGRRLMKFQKQ